MAENQSPPPQISSVKLDDIRELMDFFSKKTYNASNRDEMSTMVLNRSIDLMGRDYKLFMLDNADGALSYHYPGQLPLLENEIECNQNLNPAQRLTNTIYENLYDFSHIQELVSRSKSARCRTRFPVPVILYRGKYICRSSTLSGGPEMYARTGMDYLIHGNTTTTEHACSDEACCEDEIGSAPDETAYKSSMGSLQLFDKLRALDIKLLQALNVGTIVDLMVENKKVKFGFYVTSSEKIDKEQRYSRFNLVGFPYPGCEFFTQFHHKDIETHLLYFDWKQPECDASLTIPDQPDLSHLKIRWEDYKKWDLLNLTKNYMRYLLKYFQDVDSGMLVHCISGWDRTPMFISLLRLSLWADGLIHHSLDEHEMLYFTLAYDWMLFGHHLSSRLKKREHIMLFSFYFLKFLTGSEYSIAPLRCKKQKAFDKPTDKSEDSFDPDSPDIEVIPESEDDEPDESIHAVSPQVEVLFLERSLPSLDEANGNIDVPDPMRKISPQSKRTSPVAVPKGPKLRRTDSLTTNSGSWQHVTSTGSIKGSDSLSSQELNSSSSNINSEDGSQETSKSATKTRKERLLKVRSIFHQMYWQTVGKELPPFEPETTISGVISNIVETVASISQLK